MKNIHILLVVTTIFAVLLSGCANSSLDEANLTPEGGKTGPESPATEASPVQPEPEPGETPFLEPVEGILDVGEVPREIMEEIIADLVERSGAEVSGITIIRAEAVVWNDGALGCAKPGEVYIQVLLNGYRVILEAEGLYYDYRITDSGDYKLCEEEIMPPNNQPDTGEENQNPLVSQAKEDLAERLGIALDQIELLSYEEVVWPDSSLGCPQPGMEYLQVPSDGALIRLSAGGQVYDYHSGGNRGIFLCEQTLKVKPASPKIDLFKMTPPPQDTGDQ